MLRLQDFPSHIDFDVLDAEGVGGLAGVQHDIDAAAFDGAAVRVFEVDPAAERDDVRIDGDDVGLGGRTEIGCHAVLVIVGLTRGVDGGFDLPAIPAAALRMPAPRRPERRRHAWLLDRDACCIYGTIGDYLTGDGVIDTN
ncbi:hypothetical protein SAMN04488502_103105 [Dendrosporobacter quercicolus]|uniref:Uncharacterized protein n=1 Tax=Dendrosporobacter quercicolus TaxID=146817 RepID=A0A1G9RUB3_9FIRM|nr:hypothetical protein SAMN04488502_103105 [Dendrosporobacter quercicolus]